MAKLGDEAKHALDLLLAPAAWLAAQAELLAGALFPRAGESSGARLLKRVGYGLVGAAYACMVLTALLAAAVALGVGLVRLWVEEPVVVRQKLYFDYAEFHPAAVFSFKGELGSGEMSRFSGVPVGHTYSVSVVMLLPESQHNRDLGVFQLTAEVLSTNGNLMARASQPCMLKFRSRLVRLARTLLMGVPLVLGSRLEAEKLTVNLLKYREGRGGSTYTTDPTLHEGKAGPRTGSVRITLIPRAGTTDLPELYESEILVRSQLPRAKEFVRSWKWTFYVWASLYAYVALLALVLCCFRRLVFPRVAGPEGGGKAAREERVAAEVEEMDGETLRQWQHYRRKRKAEVLGRRAPPSESAGVGSSATSYTVLSGEGAETGGDPTAVEDVADSSSVCWGLK